MATGPAGLMPRLDAALRKHPDWSIRCDGSVYRAWRRDGGGEEIVRFLLAELLDELDRR